VFVVLPLFHWWVSARLLDRPQSLLNAGTFCTKVVKNPQGRTEPAEVPRILIPRTRVNKARRRRPRHSLRPDPLTTHTNWSHSHCHQAPVVFGAYRSIRGRGSIPLAPESAQQPRAHRTSAIAIIAPMERDLHHEVRGTGEPLLLVQQNTLTIFRLGLLGSGLFHALSRPAARYSTCQHVSMSQHRRSGIQLHQMDRPSIQTSQGWRTIP
jgi:hypothetical protein